MNKTRANAGDEIFRRAAGAFLNIFPGRTKIETLQLEPPGIAGLAGFRPDRLIRIVTHNCKLKYYAEIKTTVTKTQRILLLINKTKLQHPLLLITRYVNPEMAEQLKQDGLEFIDAAGNIFINQPPLYVFVKGNGPLEAIMPIPPKRVFRPAGLRVIFAFLCNPGLENKTYREITVEANVAIGTVKQIMDNLKGLGFLLDMGKRGYKLQQKEILLQRWVTAYPEQLRANRMLGRYRGEYGWWQNKRLDPIKAQWGGEFAAARLTQYLQPQMITIYTTARQLNELLLENKLKKDPAGDVEILERFWMPRYHGTAEGLPGEVWQTGQYVDLVHPILVYADLLATGNERNIETAKIIYEQYITRLIRED